MTDLLTQPQFLIVGILLFIVAIVFNVIRNHKIILDKGAVNHTKEWFVKAVSCSFAVASFSLASNFVWLVALLVSGIMLAFNFWVWFDGFLNLRRGYSFFFAGSEDNDDANTDNILQSMPEWLRGVIKISLAGGSIYLYILGYSK